LRQQLAIDLLDHCDGEPAAEAVEEAGDEDGGEEAGDDVADALPDEADAPSAAAEPAGVAFAQPNAETAKGVRDGGASCDATGGPHLET
jgi:hypothetical protein